MSESLYPCCECRGDGWQIKPKEGDAGVRCPVCKGQPNGVHTIPVPRGWSPEQAWEAIKRGDLLTDPEPCWANIVVSDGKFVELCDA